MGVGLGDALLYIGTGADLEPSIVSAALCVPSV